MVNGHWNNTRSAEVSLEAMEPVPKKGYSTYVYNMKTKTIELEVPKPSIKLSCEPEEALEPTEPDDDYEDDGIPNQDTNRDIEIEHEPMSLLFYPSGFGAQ